MNIEGRNDIINFEKKRKTASVIKDICTYQQSVYNFKKVDIIYDFLDQITPLSEDEMYKQSKKIEPGTGNIKKKKGLIKKASGSIINLFK